MLKLRNFLKVGSSKRTHQDAMMAIHPDDADMSESQRPPAPKMTKFEDNLKSSPFPDLVVPEMELTEDSDSESVFRRDEAITSSSVCDEDVAMFMSLAARMSLKSLLHLLQGAARAQNNLPAVEGLQEYHVLHALEKTSISPTSPETQDVPDESRKKCFRFAEVRDHQVRTVVHEIESIKDQQNLWWSPEEMSLIRVEQIQVVRHYKKHRPRFVQAVTTMLANVESSQLLENAAKHVTQEDSFARGLEGHIVSAFGDIRRAHAAAILQEQQDCREGSDDYDVQSVCLREASMAYSKLSTDYCELVGECDHIEALKASMSRWRAEQQDASAFWGS